MVFSLILPKHAKTREPKDECCAWGLIWDLKTKIQRDPN